MLYLIIFIVAIFSASTGIIYLILSKSRLEALVTDANISSTLMDWAKEASRQVETDSNRFKRPIWLMIIYILLGMTGLIGGTLYFKTLPAGILCGALLFLIPEQIVNQRMIARNNKIMEQLGIAVRIFTSEYRDTPHPVRALEITSKKIPKPLGTVLQDTVRDFSSSKSIDETLLGLSKKLNTPYGRMFAQLLRQSFDDNAVTNLFTKLSARLSSRQDLVQENNKQTTANRMLISALNIAVIPVFLGVTKVFPESYTFFTQDIAGRLIIILALSSAVGAVLLDRVLNGGNQFD